MQSRFADLSHGGTNDHVLFTRPLHFFQGLCQVEGCIRPVKPGERVGQSSHELKFSIVYVFRAANRLASLVPSSGELSVTPLSRDGIRSCRKPVTPSSTRRQSGAASDASATSIGRAPCLGAVPSIGNTRARWRSCRAMSRPDRQRPGIPPAIEERSSCPVWGRTLLQIRSERDAAVCACEMVARAVRTHHATNGSAAPSRRAHAFGWSLAHAECDASIGRRAKPAGQHQRGARELTLGKLFHPVGHGFTVVPLDHFAQQRGLRETEDGIVAKRRTFACSLFQLVTETFTGGIGGGEADSDHAVEILACAKARP